ncbi:MAG: GNAT family N-acetyltransferase [Tannerellaceae bacterium]|jgi:RimJ/RimL family protein N-acetyltransferase|nr:GNAT family N-acetyltransferase [Tannerellaceae bacterium]
MHLETHRLQIVPLTARQLRLWTEDISALEKELNCLYKAEPMDEELKLTVQWQICLIDDDDNEYSLFETFWFIIRKSDRAVVGSACFKGCPDKNNEVEIGYGLNSGFERNGYMTETVKAMCRWALENPDVLHVTAETEINNHASQNVLQRCGFTMTTKSLICTWRL